MRRPSDATVMHESAHVAAARILGLQDVRVMFTHPVWDDGVAALTSYGEGGERSALKMSIVSYAPVFKVVGADWRSEEVAGDRAILERLTPAHWPSPDIWTYHVALKTKELVASETFSSAFTDAVVELDQQIAVM